jgi:steroid 5-alpha reductase family enzyme
MGLDIYGLTSVTTVAMQLVFFAIAYCLEIDLVTDLAGSTNFVVLALMSLFLFSGDLMRTRPIVLTVLLTVTRIELAGFLLYRVCNRKRDARFDQVRQRFFPFLFFWVFQMFWVWLVSLPNVFVNSSIEDPEIGAVDVLGWCLFIAGFVLQVVADWQKYNFRAKQSNSGRFCDVGVWKVSRHPNYFGEIAMWWGMWVAAYPVIEASGGTAIGWATLVSPLFTMVILLFFSGLPTAEGANLSRFYRSAEEGRRWDAYRLNTSPMVPLPPCVYSRTPKVVKLLFLCEFPFLEYHSRETPSSEVSTFQEEGQEQPPVTPA